MEDKEFAFREQLLTMPIDERASHLAGSIRTRIAQILGRNESTITFDTPFGNLSLEQGGRESLFEPLRELVQEKLGRPLHHWEFIFPPRGVEKPDSIEQLAEYLARDMEIPAPESGFTDPYEGGNWSWGLPAPVPKSIERNRPVAFILSTARSGSTLLRVMLEKHPIIFCPPELYLLQFESMVERREKILRLGYPWMRWGLDTALSKLQQLNPEWKRLSTEDLEADDVPIPQVYRMMQELIGERLLVDKTPLYAAHPGWLRRAEEMFEKPKYLYLARHPYAVIESFVRMRFHQLMGNHWLNWDANPWLNAEKHWAVYNRHVLDFLEDVESERRHRVCYEELVANPRTTLNDICEFLGIPFHEGVLDPYSGDSTDFEVGDPNLRDRSRVEPGLATAWQEKRPPQELSSFTGQVADELGYQIDH